ncbi:MAG: hypothetical protein ACLQVD_21310 [Capsulimonadaceae bacterium]
MGKERTTDMDNTTKTLGLVPAAPRRTRPVPGAMLIALDEHAAARPATKSRARARIYGQTAVIAMLVMLLLAFIGALFVTIVARNQQNARGGEQIQTADYYAQAGIDYANKELLNSDLGADWRPVPLNAKQLAAIPSTDPDQKYLLTGYVRFNLANGRFLLRVTYKPAPTLSTWTPQAGPPALTSQAITQASGSNTDLIEIDSIGRQGIVDPNDPTTFASASGRTASLVAYKRLGLTDYCRWETNIDNRSDIMNLGVPSVWDIQTAAPPTGDTTGDVAAPSIVTPGVVDVNSTPGGFYSYPVVTTYGAPDAYLVENAGTANPVLVPNPQAGAAAPTYNTTGPNANKWTVTTTGANPITAYYAPGGGAIRANASLRFFGLNEIYLNNAGYQTYLATNWGSVQAQESDLLLNEQLEVSGDILLDQYSPAQYLPSSPTTPVPLDGETSLPFNGQPAALLLNPTNGTATEPTGSTATFPLPYVTPSSAIDVSNNNAPSFDGQGAIRDGEAGSDIHQFPRQEKRLDPPVIDNVVTDTGMTRYQDMALNSAQRPNTPTGVANPALNGLGQIIYVNNASDIQKDTTKAGVPYNLEDEWLNRAQSAGESVNKYGWNGPIYTPPGVEITFGDLRPYGYTPPTGTNPSTGKTYGSYGVYLLRTDYDINGNPITWPGGNQGMIVPYEQLNAANPPSVINPTPPATATYANNDVIIVAQGNVRISGSVSADASDPSVLPPTPSYPTNAYPRHVLIVTLGTAYIDGSVLKGNPDSSIAILAHDYVCVNTTMFTAGRPVNAQPATIGSVTGPDGLTFGVGDSLAEQFLFGLPSYNLATVNTPSTQYANTELALYYSGAAGPSMGGSTSGPPASILDFSLYDPILGGPTSTVDGSAGVALPYGQVNQIYVGTAPPSSLTAAPVTDTLPIPAGSGSSLLSLVESQPLQLWIQTDPGATDSTVLYRAVVLPMDVRIEAVMYAQTKSFFVIPGDWFSINNADTLPAYIASTSGTAYRPGLTISDPNQGRIPFYGQPLDLKITIHGSVSEARPPDIGAQNDWMMKWGWIPQYHGNLIPGAPAEPPTEPGGEPSGHPGYISGVNAGPSGAPSIGLQIIYDPLAAYPVTSFLGTNSGQYLRYDAYGNVLPFVPRLPVCPGLIYAGQANHLSLQ